MQRPKADEVLTVIRDCGPISRLELQGMVRRSKMGVNDSLLILRRDKLIHIAGWARQQGHGGAYAPLYGYGNKTDADKPKARPPKERNAAFRERNRALIRTNTRIRRGSKTNIWGGLML